MVKEKKSTRLIILEAADAEFLEKGYDGTTTASIAARAKVTHAMLHYYFQTKENLFEMFIQGKMALVKEAICLPERTTAPASLEDQIRYIVSHHMDFLLRHPELPKFMLREICFNRDRMAMFAAVAQQDGNIMDVAASLKKAAEEEGLSIGFDIRSIIIEMALFNISAFISADIHSSCFGASDEAVAAMIEERKAENTERILKMLGK